MGLGILGQLGVAAVLGAGILWWVLRQLGQKQKAEIDAASAKNVAQAQIDNQKAEDVAEQKVDAIQAAARKKQEEHSKRGTDDPTDF